MQNDYDCTVQKVDVSRLVMHEMYNMDTSENDIAILELDKSLIFNKYVQPACLPEKDYNYPVNKLGVGDPSAIGLWVLFICFYKKFCDNLLLQRLQS